MQPLRKLTLLLLAVLVAFPVTTARAAGDTDKDKDKKEKADADRARQLWAAKYGGQNCSPGQAFATLDANNVRAGIYNTGALFRGDAAGVIYEVPKGSGIHSIFASGIWIGGQTADGDLRMAAATYAQGGEDYEFFPGPLGPNGEAPTVEECQTWDRIFKVSRDEVDEFLAGVSGATQDMIDWPAEEGAPFLDAEELDGADNDGDGEVDEEDEGDGVYNLENGDVPDVTGDQTLWWIMNDAAGPHLTTQAAPLGLEVRAEAFSFNTADALNNTTFYRYTMEYQPVDGETLEDVYFGLWVDPDLGQYTDDFVGSDTTLGLGFVYNGDALDEGYYGNEPPALGYDFFQGPLVNNDGLDNDGDGVADEPDERLQMEKFVYYNNDGSEQGNPDGADEYYGYLAGLWRDNSPITFGGDGYNTGAPTNYMFPGNPPEFWSEDNVDGAGTANTPSDRRFLQSAGPFTLEPGDVQEIVFGIVWSRTGNRHGSVAQLKADDIVAQGAFDFNFDVPPAPDAPDVTAEGFNNQVVLSWSNDSLSNNYLNSYDQPSPFLVNPNATDTTYTFEGYVIRQFRNASDSEGQVIATLDVENGVTVVTDEQLSLSGAPIEVVVVEGSDTGIQNYLVINNDFLRDGPIRNYTEYFYSVQPYAYNAASSPRVRFGPEQSVEVVPSKSLATETGVELQASAGEDVVQAEIDKLSDAIINARVIDPSEVSGATYEVRAYEYTPEDGGDAFITYNLVNVTSGETVVNGGRFYERTGQMLSLTPEGGTNVITAGGLSFTIVDAPAGWAGDGAGIIETMWAGEPVSGNEYGGDAIWHALNSTADYFVSANGSGGLDRMSRYIRDASPRDFEMRFTEEGGYAVYPFDDNRVAEVPFELWDTGIGTPDDPSDDVRMIPFLLGTDDGTTTGDWNWGAYTEGYFGYPAPAPVYWMDPNPDAGGYAGFAASAEACGVGNIYDAATCADDASYHAEFTSPAYPSSGFVYPIGRMMIGDFAGDNSIPSGTTIRMVTTKPLAPGDVFTIDTAPVSPAAATDSTIQEAVDLITVVPNPYRGASSYDVSTFEDQVRITNLPNQATIRIFTVSGSQIRLLEKDGPANYIPWDLRTDDGLPIASGIYLIHVELEDGTEKVLKFAVVKKRIQLDVF